MYVITIENRNKSDKYFTSLQKSYVGLFVWDVFMAMSV